jgi:hypothetical protein
MGADHVGPRARPNYVRANPLTPEQQAAFDRVPVGVRLRPSGDQTLEQARNLAIDTFIAACDFDGIGIPSEAAVEAAITDATASRPRHRPPPTKPGAV